MRWPSSCLLLRFVIRLVGISESTCNSLVAPRDDRRPHPDEPSSCTATGGSGFRRACRGNREYGHGMDDRALLVFLCPTHYLASRPCWIWTGGRKKCTPSAHGPRAGVGGRPPPTVATTLRSVLTGSASIDHSLRAGSTVRGRETLWPHFPWRPYPLGSGHGVKKGQIQRPVESGQLYCDRLGDWFPTTCIAPRGARPCGAAALTTVLPSRSRKWPPWRARPQTDCRWGQ